jgi:hypothetical protein
MKLESFGNMVSFHIEIYALEPFTFGRCFGFNGGDHSVQPAATAQSPPSLLSQFNQVMGRPFLDRSGGRPTALLSAVPAIFLNFRMPRRYGTAKRRPSTGK